MKIVLEIDLEIPGNQFPQYLEGTEHDLADWLEAHGFTYVTARWSQVDQHPPKFTRTREEKPMVVGEQLVLDREYQRVDL